jgi:hypothetical protein
MKFHMSMRGIIHIQTKCQLICYSSSYGSEYKREDTMFIFIDFHVCFECVFVRFLLTLL